MIGNFTKVKQLIKPQFRVCKDDMYHNTRIIIFPEDVIMKLYPAPLCNFLTDAQDQHLHKPYRKGEGIEIYNYGFEHVEDFKQNGGCVLIPQCMQENCNNYGCKRPRHLILNKRIKPNKFKMFHTCGFDKKNKIALLSCEQFIIHQFLKTQSTNEMKLQSSEEQIVNDVVRQMNIENEDIMI